MVYKNIVYLGWKSIKQIRYGYLIADEDYIKLFFRPHGDMNSKKLEIKQLTRIFNKHLIKKGFILVDGGNHIKSYDDVNIRCKRIEYKKGKAYKKRNEPKRL